MYTNIYIIYIYVYMTNDICLYGFWKLKLTHPVLSFKKKSTETVVIRLLLSKMMGRLPIMRKKEQSLQDLKLKKNP